MELNITTGQKVRVTASPTAASGAAASLDGPLRVLALEGTGTVNLTGDPLSVELVSGDIAEDVVYMISGDSDLGSGEALLAEQVIVHVTLAVQPAVILNLSASAPENK